MGHLEYRKKPDSTVTSRKLQNLLASPDLSLNEFSIVKNFAEGKIKCNIEYYIQQLLEKEKLNETS